MGLKSLKNIKVLIPHIFELGLNNLRINGGILGDKKYIASDVIEEILRTTADEGTKLMKLKITKMNLGFESIVYQLTKTMQWNKNMISLDVSYGQMHPKHLRQLSQGLVEFCPNFRNLNLSYNILNLSGSDSSDSV